MLVKPAHPQFHTQAQRDMYSMCTSVCVSVCVCVCACVCACVCVCLCVRMGESEGVWLCMHHECARHVMRITLILNKSSLLEKNSVKFTVVTTYNNMAVWTHIQSSYEAWYKHVYTFVYHTNMIYTHTHTHVVMYTDRTYTFTLYTHTTPTHRDTHRYTYKHTHCHIREVWKRACVCRCMFVCQPKVCITSRILRKIWD